ncbi:MAG TPA: dTDP-4-dehydrorhamnose 3,5-epimerase [Pyrinomonadaceae bacterium]|jgi:dTDP-4-dehydrorhamnose 3,5-epimerase
MNTTRLDLGPVLLELDVYRDARGFFVERFHLARFRDFGLPTKFVQDNHSRSLPGVLRGLHFTSDLKQGKLVSVTRGRVWDVAVDIRPASPTRGRHVAVELDGDDGRALWIPPGFAHGFCVLGEEPADVLYKVDDLYNPATDAGIIWDDPELAIPWPVERPILSEKDRRLQSFAEYRQLMRGKTD